MKKLKLKSTFLFCIVIYLVFSTQIEISSSSLTWSDIENSLTYDFQRVDTIYNDLGLIVEIQNITDIYRFWDFQVEYSQLTFRTNKYSKALNQLYCVTIECYNWSLYHQFAYDPGSDSIILGFEYDEITKKYFLIDGVLDPFANFFNCSIPLDIMSIYFNNYYWDGIYGIFLPVNHETFSFRTDYTDYGDNYSTIEHEYETDFSYKDEFYVGHHIQIGFTGGRIFGQTIIFENHNLSFKYSNLGYLISFEDTGEMYSNISNIVQLEKKIDWSLRLRIESETNETTFLIPVLFSIFAINLILLFKRRKIK